MKLYAIESTARLVLVDGLPARVWEGETSRGARVTLFVCAVAVDDDDDDAAAEIDAELVDRRPPSLVPLARCKRCGELGHVASPPTESAGNNCRAAAKAKREAKT